MPAPWDVPVWETGFAAARSWTCIAPITIHHPKGRIQVTPGSSFTKGANFMGVDPVAWFVEQMADKDSWKKQG
jgi:hypothetical protein